MTAPEGAVPRKAIEERDALYHQVCNHLAALGDGLTDNIILCLTAEAVTKCPTAAVWGGGKKYPSFKKITIIHF